MPEDTRIQNITTLTDREIIEEILHGNKSVIEYFFLQKCSKVIRYIANTVFKGDVDDYEIINELLLYLSANDWDKLQKFDFRSKLTTWTAVVAVRFFIKNRNKVLGFGSNETQICEFSREDTDPVTQQEAKWDLERALNRLPNPRYRMVITELDLNEKSPEELAMEMGITIANLYNLHHRALKQLKQIIKG